MTDRPRRIAFCITELDPGGAERALVQIVTRLDRSHWEPRVFCLSGPGEMAAPLEAAEIPVHYFGVKSRLEWSVVRRLTRELRAFDPEVLQTFLFHANLAGRLAAWRAGVFVVVSGVRVVEPDLAWRMRVDRWTNRLVTHTVCVSQAVASTYQSLGFHAEQLSVIPNGVDVEQFAAAVPADLSEFGIPATARTLLAVGRLHPQKGFDRLLDAVGPIFETHPNVHLLIIGEGEQRGQLEARATQSAHASRLHLPGRRDDVAALMRACDMFVLSSRWEGMPNVLLEAMAAGLPVVATDVEGVRDIVIHGETGIVVEKDSAAALSMGIQCLLDHDDAHRMGIAGQQRVRTEFSWQQAAEQYDLLYRRLLTRTRADE